MLDSHLAQQADRDQVAGVGQGISEAGGPEKLSTVVFRAPGRLQPFVIENDGCVIDDAGRIEARFECCGIDEGLEAGAWLAFGPE